MSEKKILVLICCKPSQKYKSGLPAKNICSKKNTYKLPIIIWMLFRKEKMNFLGHAKYFVSKIHLLFYWEIS